VAYAAGGDKKLNEECKSDSECKHGHCYKKKSGDKVCVNCSSSTISSARYNIQARQKNLWVVGGSGRSPIA
jgi:hypothetical protein